MKHGAHLNKLLALGSGLVGLGAWASLPVQGSPAPAAQPLPTPFPEARYERMSAKSPFAVASATAAPAATPGFAAQLYVDGVAHVGNSDFVAIKSRDPGNPAAIFLEVGESTQDGMKVEGVRWSDETGKSTVDVSKAGERATLAFDQATIKTAAAAVPSLPLQRRGRFGIDYSNQGDGNGPPVPFGMRKRR
jgi:hypothetical protein